MATRPLPPPPPTITCSCGGKFGLDFPGEGRTPVAYHSLPYCPAFDAIGSTVDAITHFERCKKPSRA